MKTLILSLLCFASAAAFAAEVGEITMAAPKASAISTDKNNSSEVGINYSSLNNGSAFATVGMIHEWDNGFAIGLRGFLPMQFSKQAQIFMGQAIARFMLLNDVDQMFIEGTMAQGFFNGTGNGLPFVTLGADYGFLHKFTSQLAAGGSLGIDYSNDRIEDNVLSGSRTLYSKISLTGAYYF